MVVEHEEGTDGWRDWPEGGDTFDGRIGSNSVRQFPVSIPSATFMFFVVNCNSLANDSVC